MEKLAREQNRLFLQARLDAGKSQADRNRLGQFATPTALARDVLRFGVALLGEDRPIRFFDPAIGTGSFFSALLDTVPENRIERAKGYELDAHYGGPARKLWGGTPLDIEVGDFTRAKAPAGEADRFNLIICNPPYVRHHHIANGEKTRLQAATKAVCEVRIAGLAGLYCYFIGLSHAWMQRGGVAGWLIPSEFMDVNYGEAVKRYLLDKVTLLRIHRFDPNEVQFDDAVVSSAIVWFRNHPPPADQSVEFTFGGSLFAPKLSRTVPATALRKNTKWTRFPVSEVREEMIRYRLSEIFTIKRGIATGSNKFFILTGEQIAAYGLPREVFRPILPSPRYVPIDEIDADRQGVPLLDRRLFLLNCRLPEAEVRKRYPKLWAYLEGGRGEISERYLCRSRPVWYFQEERPPAPLLCTYLGRGDARGGRPFRFILNHSQATAANVYLLLYPKPVFARALARDQSLLRRVWELLNRLSPTTLLGEGRVYGGGLHKLEPRELGNVDATAIAADVSEVRGKEQPVQASLFDQTSPA
jgi:adenine-specific DNA-methyltransferase